MVSWLARCLVRWLAVTLFALGAVTGHADGCTELALAELERLFPEMTQEQRAETRTVLASICAEPPATTQAGDADPVESAGDPETLLGVELNKADPDSKGHSRLRRTH